MRPIEPTSSRWPAILTVLAGLAGLALWTWMGTH
jgi:hypothetical protein